MKISSRIAFVALTCMALQGVTAPVQAGQKNDVANPVSVNIKVTQTEAALRDLWLGHGFWVRNVVLATLSGDSAAAAAAEKEAISNAKQIAASIEPFYGKDASEKFFTLLGGHYLAIKQYLDATVARSGDKQVAASKAMVANGGDIAAFLSNANPNLPFEVLRGSLMAHGGHHMQQIQQLSSKNYEQEAQTWEAMKTHMYGISAALTAGLAKQFPAKFI